MPWRSNGDYYIFQEESINANAPADSGVYGLYNIKRQIFIGETSNIRQALLRHDREDGIQLALYRPTGFTFEVCPAESRAQRVRELITEYRPVLQTRDPFDLRRLWRRWLNSGANAFDPYTVIEADEANGARQLSIAAKRKPAKKPVSLSRRHLVLAGSGLIAATVLVVSLAVLGGKKSERIEAVKNQTAASDTTSAESLQNWPRLPIGQGGEPSASAEQWTAKREMARLDQAIREDSKLPENNAPVTPGTRSAGVKQPTSPPAKKPARIWSVQVRSYPEKGPAVAWVERLIGKGYEAFMVPADVRGQTWYRVQVGRFDDPQQAESLRQELQVRERLNDAFLTAAAARDQPLS